MLAPEKLMLDGYQVSGSSTFSGSGKRLGKNCFLRERF